MTNGARPRFLLILAAILLMTTTQVVAYVGSDACQFCHASKYNMWVESGHPYKLTEIFDEAPIDQFPMFSQYPNDPVDPPAGYTWSDITYTIGGYGWKMRWIDSNGYIVTSGAAADLVQYNFENDSWVTYHTEDEPGTKPYDCGGCHTTGWVANPDPSDLSGNQDGLPGMWGTFFAGGVHCEQCHGEADDHVGDPNNVDMVVDDSSELCGQCHTRDPENHIAASGGFIKHHEQYDEWLHSPHVAGPGCNTCHDPHASVKFDDEAVGNGNLTSCEDCHAEQAAFSEHIGLPACTDCHMPKASKSAVAVHDYQGDIPTHIWSINTAPVGKTEGMFNAEGNFVLEDADGQSRITLDFACYGCHRDPDGVGGIYSMKTLSELSDMATNIHGTAVGVPRNAIPAAVALNNAYPNPFNPRTTVSFNVGRSQHVTVSVYNMAGQQVALLADQVYAAGEHTTDWQGRNTLGQNVASGTYLVNIRAGDVSESVKIQLVR